MREVQSEGTRVRRAATRLFLFLALLIAVAMLGAGSGAAATDPGGNGLQRALRVQERHADQLLAKKGVVGTATGFEHGAAAIEVYTARRGVRGIPRKLDGVPVDIDVTGKISALLRANSKPAPSARAGGLRPTDRWPRPVPIGISTGNVGECSAGTIGARVTSGGQVYALSNNHVYALENTAPIGSYVLQPGRYDTGCAVSANDVLGQLSEYEPLKFNGQDNFIDAAIAVSTTSLLGNSTPPNGYGAPSSVPVDAQLGQTVQKYGRTTALTYGRVAAINAVLNVAYDSGTARFVDQVIVQSRKPFLKAGDSGSLTVTVPDRNPVALLFAGDGSGKFAVANEIDRVLSRFGVTVDGS